MYLGPLFKDKKTGRNNIHEDLNPIMMQTEVVGLSKKNGVDSPPRRDFGYVNSSTTSASAANYGKKHSVPFPISNQTGCVAYSRPYKKIKSSLRANSMKRPSYQSSKDSDLPTNTKLDHRLAKLRLNQSSFFDFAPHQQQLHGRDSKDGDSMTQLLPVNSSFENNQASGHGANMVSDQQHSTGSSQSPSASKATPLSPGAAGTHLSPKSLLPSVRLNHTSGSINNFQ